MLSYCCKCRKKQKVETQGLQRQVKENQCCYQNVPRVIVKNRNLSKSKKQVC